MAKSRSPERETVSELAVEAGRAVVVAVGKALLSALQRRRSNAASDRVAEPCDVTITDRVRPAARQKLRLKDGRGEEWWFDRAAQPTNRLTLTPPAQRDLRARGWSVAPVKE